MAEITIHREKELPENMLGIILKYAIKKINLQHILYLTAILTFGIGDALTSAYMMTKIGTEAEFNLFAKYLFTTHGWEGILTVKLWFTLAILAVAFVNQHRSKEPMYWATNGFLGALIIGGILAMTANIQAALGMAHAAPTTIIMVFLAMAFVLTEIGDLVDKYQARKKHSLELTRLGIKTEDFCARQENKQIHI